MEKHFFLPVLICLLCPLLPGKRIRHQAECILPGSLPHLVPASLIVMLLHRYLPSVAASKIDESDEMVIRTEPDQTGRVFENTEVVLYVSLGPSIVLDDYVGMPSGEVISLLSALGPTVTERYEQSEIFPYGVVLSTEPAAGTEISTSSEVIVVISQGTAVTMEDYTGRDISEVRVLLEGKGLVVAVEYVMTNSVSPGTVLGMDREVGELVPGGSTVRFSVAEEDTRILLDDWVGRPASEAKAELEELGLSVELSYVTSDTSPEGVVIQMNPSGGEYADPGSLVELVVSSGSAPVTSEPETTEPETTEPSETEPETEEP